MPRSRRSLSVLAPIVALVVLAGAACSSSDDADAPPDATDAPVEMTTTAVDPADAPARPSPGCDSPVTDEVTSMRQDLTVGDQQRYYLLTTPVPTTEPIPLVVDLHGLMEGAEIHSIMTQYSALAQEEGFAVVFPHGSGDPVRWDAAPASDPNLDLEFLDAMLDHLGNERCIDEARIYATGLSYGAIMSTFLACERSEVFAAIAPIDGITIPEGCDPARPVPMLSSHGTEDPILLFNGGYGDIGGLVQGGAPPPATSAPSDAAADLTGPGYPQAVADWAALNGCSDEFTDTDVSDTVVHRVYDCPVDAAVEFYIVKGGGHSWPGSDFSAAIEDIVGPTTFDIDATAAGWEFFQRFSLPAS